MAKAKWKNTRVFGCPKGAHNLCGHNVQRCLGMPTIFPRRLGKHRQQSQIVQPGSHVLITRKRVCCPVGPVHMCCARHGIISTDFAGVNCSNRTYLCGVHKLHLWTKCLDQG